ncbi:hypothetical protein CTAYLR_006959 [Chrysophaeum taylorii]|uniref:Peptidase S54 rhomboid domain-containing protein n=1 Tax=Chrysophaeum taylorii TaxID=2483200 RepID=A0AAD7UFR1_9STRA|nr:hypothetical protein CTAYLR_006959 [Chrysophaeum taylorii]
MGRRLGWLRRWRLLYTEEPAAQRRTGRVASLELPVGTRVEVRTGTFTVELKNGTTGRFKLDFVRGFVKKFDQTYDIEYLDGPYALDDPRAPPPGYPRRESMFDQTRLRRCAAATLKRVAPELVSRDDPLPMCPPLVSAALAATHLLCFAFSNTRPGPPILYYQLVGDFATCEDQRRQFWRLATYQFVHTSYFHVASNCVMLLLFGSPIEITHGHDRLLLLHQLGVVAGALLCGVGDSYDSVVGASGGTYALLGAHAANIYKDWDRLKDGVLNRRLRISFIGTLLAADVGTWHFTRKANISYAAHLGGAAMGLLLGVLVLRRRRARFHAVCLKKLKRPAFVAALALFCAYFGFGFAWYAFVWPPRPLTHAWYDHRRRKHRPCCIQILDCGLSPLRDLVCDISGHEFTIRTSHGVPLETCDALRAYRDATSRSVRG